MKISVVILTRNEDKNLAACLESVSQFNDVVVFDSFSTDRTQEIAARAGARFVKRSFDNFGAQRQAALSLDFKHDWVLMLDADERVGEDLRKELESIDLRSTEFKAFRMRRKDFFLGRWIRRASLYPSWFVRLLKRGHAAYDRPVHEYPIIAGFVGELQGHLLHFSFNNGLDRWFEKHRAYARLEAEHAAADEPLRFLSCFSRDPVVRRRAWKRVFGVIPGRPVFRFVYMYFVRRAFLDGMPGLLYCVMLFNYEVMISLYRIEIDRRSRGLSV